MGGCQRGPVSLRLSPDRYRALGQSPSPRLQIIIQFIALLIYFTTVALRVKLGLPNPLPYLSESPWACSPGVISNEQ